MNAQKTITFITGNAKKLAEVQAFFPQVQGLDLDLPEIQSLDMHEIVTAKLVAAFEHYSGPIMVDDTALYLDCMQSKDGSPGLPGPLIKWYLQTIGNRKITQMAVALGNTKAQGKTVIGYATNPHDIMIFEGCVPGRVINPDREIGFGFDAIFVPDGHEQTLAELTIEEKNKISMRGMALQQLKKYIELTV